MAAWDGAHARQLPSLSQLSDISGTHKMPQFRPPTGAARGPRPLCARRKRKNQTAGDEAGSSSTNDSDDPNQFGLDGLDPYQLGRRSRQAFDDVWQQFTRLAQPTKSFSFQDDSSLLGDASMDFVAPDAAMTTVLVVGATGRVGKVVLRKLLLRGYDVRALVRERGTEARELPPAVKVVEGDVCDYQQCLKAVQDTDKIIYAAGARSYVTADIRRVEAQGVSTLAKAFMDYRWKKARQRGGFGRSSKRQVADFRSLSCCQLWAAEMLGNPKEKPLSKMGMRYTEEDGRRQWGRSTDSIKLTQTENGNLNFKGRVSAVGDVAEIGATVALPGSQNLGDCEALVLRVKGDGNTYAMVLTSDKNAKYVSRFPTRRGYSTVRLPFNTFRPEVAGDPPLEPSLIRSTGLRFESKGRYMISQSSSESLPSGQNSTGDFNLEIDWIKAIVAGQETDFLLVSCAGIPRPDIEEPLQRTLASAKLAGEAVLRNSGLGYTIIRPTTIIDEPGGYKALVFDQGDRLTQSISAADVADVCVRALHQPLARNKTFEVAQEYTPEDGLEMYELVAHVPDMSTNYLGSALVNLEKNT